MRLFHLEFSLVDMTHMDCDAYMGAFSVHSLVLPSLVVSALPMEQDRAVPLTKSKWEWIHHRNQWALAAHYIHFLEMSL